MSEGFDKDLQEMIDERDGAPVRIDSDLNKVDEDLFGGVEKAQKKPGQDASQTMDNSLDKSVDESQSPLKRKSVELEAVSKRNEDDAEKTKKIDLKEFICL